MSKKKKRRVNDGREINVEDMDVEDFKIKEEGELQEYREKVMAVFDGEKWRFSLRSYFQKIPLRERSIANREEIALHNRRIEKRRLAELRRAGEIEIEKYGNGINLVEEGTKFSRATNAERIEKLKEIGENDNEKMKIILCGVLKYFSWKPLRQFIRINILKKNKVLRDMCVKDMVEAISCTYLGIDSNLKRRIEEVNNLNDLGDQDYRHLKMHFGTKRIEIPCDVVYVIFSHFEYNMGFLVSIGSISKATYLMILQSWPKVTVRKNLVYSIPVYILRNVKTIIFEAKSANSQFRDAELDFIIQNISSNRIRYLEFHMLLHPYQKTLRYFHLEIPKWFDNPLKEVRGIKFVPSMKMFDNRKKTPVKRKDMEYFYTYKKWSKILLSRFFPKLELVHNPMRFVIVQGLEYLYNIAFDFTVPFQVDLKKKDMLRLPDIKKNKGILKFLKKPESCIPLITTPQRDYGLEKMKYRRIKILVHPSDKLRIQKIPVFLLTFPNLTHLEFRFSVKGYSIPRNRPYQENAVADDCQVRELNFYIFSTFKNLEELILVDERQNISFNRCWDFPVLDKVYSLEEKKRGQKPKKITKWKDTLFFPSLTKLRIPMDHVHIEDIQKQTTCTAEDVCVILSIPNLSEVEVSCNLLVTNDRIDEVEKVRILTIFQMLNSVFVERTKLQSINIQFVWKLGIQNTHYYYHSPNRKFRLCLQYNPHTQRYGVSPFIDLFLIEDDSSRRGYKEDQMIEIDDVYILEIILSDFVQSVAKGRKVVVFREFGVNSLKCTKLKNEEEEQQKKKQNKKKKEEEEEGEGEIEIEEDCRQFSFKRKEERIEDERNKKKEEIPFSKYLRKKLLEKNFVYKYLESYCGSNNNHEFISETGFHFYFPQGYDNMGFFEQQDNDEENKIKKTTTTTITEKMDTTNDDDEEEEETITLQTKETHEKMDTSND